MKLLSIDSSSKSCSVSVTDSQIVLSEISYNKKLQHSSIIMNLIDEVLKSTENSPCDIDGFCVSMGPGSFTGLRIGMATAKGLAQANDKPLISISSLDALANNLSFARGIVCPIFDALRNNIYTAFYIFKDGKLLRLSPYLNIGIEETIDILNDSDRLLNLMKEHLDDEAFDKVTNDLLFFDILKKEDRIIVGDDYFKFTKFFENRGNLKFAKGHLNYARASSLAFLALDELKKEKNHSVHSVNPLYLRVSQAEREYMNKYGKTVYED